MEREGSTAGGPDTLLTHPFREMVPATPPLVRSTLNIPLVNYLSVCNHVINSSIKY